MKVRGASRGAQQQSDARTMYCVRAVPAKSVPRKCPKIAKSSTSKPKRTRRACLDNLIHCYPPAFATAFLVTFTNFLPITLQTLGKVKTAKTGVEFLRLTALKRGVGRRFGHTMKQHLLSALEQSQSLQASRSAIGRP